MIPVSVWYIGGNVTKRFFRFGQEFRDHCPTLRESSRSDISQYHWFLGQVL